MPDENGEQKRLTDQRLRLLYEAAEQAGITGPLTKGDVVKRFEALERGLPIEDEFAVLITWLGRCKLIHRLDQEQYPPSSMDLYQVPDFLVVFEHADLIIPVLVEVKKTKEDRLEWSSNYHGKIQRYAELLRLPLLVAWKYRPDEIDWSCWFLFDSRLFMKPHESYKMNLETASTENLLGILAGSFLLDIRAGVGLNLQLDLSGDSTHWKEMKESGHLFGLLTSFWTDGDGSKIEDVRLSPPLEAILNCVPPRTESSVEFRDSIIISSFVLPSNHPLFAHDILPNLLTERGTSETIELRWRNVLHEVDLPVSSAEILKEAGKPENDKIVDFIFFQIPKTVPDYLKESQILRGLNSV